MSNKLPTYEALTNSVTTEKASLLHKFIFWIHNSIEKAE